MNLSGRRGSSGPLRKKGGGKEVCGGKDKQTEEKKFRVTHLERKNAGCLKQGEGRRGEGCLWGGRRKGKMA